ncbi:hypothetical protein [Streptomyces sp. 6N106]|uniref:hypothetical protein n=1 Tax=Streptomyces sp. 6N106 TaxID=3457418 RepID=UPI003FCF12F6
MSGQKKGPRTAAEEVESEITEAETDVTGEEDRGHGEAGDALTPNTDAQSESHGEDDEGGGP